MLFAVAVTTASAAPKLVCPEPINKFGEEDNEEKVEAVFIIRNEGTETLVIDGVKCSCGCTAAHLDDPLVEPGTEVEIKATLSLKNRMGEQTKTCTVTSNDPENPMFTLTLTGTAISPVMYEPQFVSFGKVLGASVEPQTITLRAHEGEFQVTGASSTLPQVTPEVREVEAGKVYEVVAALTAPLPQGTQNGMLTIETNHPKRPRISISMYGVGVGPYDVTPDSIAFRQTDGGVPISPVLRVGPGQIEQFEITAVIAPLPGIGVEIMSRPESNYLIKLYDVPTDASLEGTELLIQTNSPDDPEIRIPFRPISPMPVPVQPASAVPTE
jgi:hypothetical protein